ncbi:MAG: peptide chain release factor 1 [Bacteroidetes bacterium GWE2_29_8]|nr:MAG: peptide chain release factor 1 [Bacteroidetes bacterium GWE2_29_8]OFY23768.1 MAG: peptide chain release factor 1 [Bacteroidetes bacterium GWF2_29_10]
MLLDKLESVYRHWEELDQQLKDPDVVSDIKKYIKLSKEIKELQSVVNAYKEYKNVCMNLDSSKKILDTEKDEEFREMAKIEVEELTETKEKMEEEIQILLLPTDPQDVKNAIVEIRAGSGGDEASIFAGDLFRMYIKFCETKRWKVELVDETSGTMGGYKEIIFNVSGDGAYGILKYESGVHRVQRVPQTEAQGRVHTSAASVVVLPEADEFDIHLSMNDVRKDTYCSSGPGGQSVNTTYSAVRLTHIPTGLVVTCQDQKSQIKNLEKALGVLRTRLFEREYSKYLDEISSKRKTMVSTGDRSAKIRTYNYPQGRVTEHRIGLTLYNLQAIIDGDIMPIIGALQVAENAERLKEGFSDI